MGDRRVAFVTGASRGIGRAACLALADAGFDVVVTARTVEEGKAADGRPLPGSVQTTAAEVRERGREALALRLDLLDRVSMDAAVDETLKQWGHIDLLVNNAIYTGEGTMQHVLDLERETVLQLFEGNVFAQLHMVQRVLPGMLERGAGTLINMVSAAGLSDPPFAAGEGGWGFAYGASKAAFHRMLGALKVEHKDSGLRLFNVEPGFVWTEAMSLNDPDGAISKHLTPAPVEVPAAVIAYLATNPDADALHGETVGAQKLCLDLRLQPDWRKR